ncbi:Mucin-6 [Varanus komodoensis]|nr:Mucin-6 [Varanus komodoensis]
MRSKPGCPDKNKRLLECCIDCSPKESTAADVFHTGRDTVNLHKILTLDVLGHIDWVPGNRGGGEGTFLLSGGGEGNTMLWVLLLLLCSILHSSDQNHLSLSNNLPGSWYVRGCHTEVGRDLFSPAEEGRMRSNGAKRRKPRFHLDARKHFLTVRRPRVWNGLPREVVEAPSVRVFKDRLDMHMYPTAKPLWVVMGCDGTGLALPLAKVKHPPQLAAVNKGSCSTWGNGHFSTFDNYLYDFSGKCNYIFATVCNDVSPDFNIQFRRNTNGKMSRIIIAIGPNVIIVENGVISVKDVGIIKLPYTKNGIQIAPFGRLIRLVAKLMEIELAVFWNNDDYLMVLIEQKYMGRTCGLCGNFDGQELNEFMSEGTLMDPYKYAALQKLDDPTEICPFEQVQLVVPSVPRQKFAKVCSQLLNIVSPSCNISRKGFILRCQLDMQTCREPGQSNCTCATLSEYSRQCAMSLQEVSDWRSSEFCCKLQHSRSYLYMVCTNRTETAVTLSFRV